MERKIEIDKKNMENKRILALDILRGMTIAGMILVNTPGSWGHIYAPLRHAEWNGLTPTDLVFPFFMFIMGISTYISLKKYHFTFSLQAAQKIIKRTVLIFLIGMAIGWFSHFCYTLAYAPADMSLGDRLWKAAWSFDTIRILGVMQRLALCYFATSILALAVNHRRFPWIIVVLLGGYSVLLLTANGYAYDETNILSIVDRMLITPAHMYKDNGIEPEGLLSTLPAIAHVMLGFCVGRMLLGEKQENKSRMEMLNQHILRLFLVGTVLTFAGFLLSYGLPLNKKIWSPTFVLTTCGLASSLLALLIWIIDVKGYKRWTLFFESFGVNPLFLYVLSGVLSILFDTIPLPWGEGTINIHTLLYTKFLGSFMNEINASLGYAILFVCINWSIGYPLYKRRIYIKL